MRIPKKMKQVRIDYCTLLFLKVLLESQKRLSREQVVGLRFPKKGIQRLKIAIEKAAAKDSEKIVGYSS